ncbi:hypothetical protein UFOVP276_110 [uncultured Caudovirales phage]|uniref:Uncharacterized protein n=1 Tax=uncultured Caudovirales phage TaxID=2100421 RepID=A0A6J5LAV3_9CAUD|nr:hypothetical protein UFOVP127_4 [uncultured Caudovirales phage]CAB4135154.1 hypothetical protein UFOVP276_110 [uncultured Caudovirales phage]
MFSTHIHVSSNVFLTARERGKLVPAMCRESHNIWVDLGKEFLPKVVSPTAGFTGHVDDSVIKYIGFGIGGDKQTVDIAAMYPTLNTDYPGQNTYSKDEHTTTRLERPVLVAGTGGVSGNGTWAGEVAAPPTFINVSGVDSTVEFTTAINEQAINLSGAYPAIPLSEVALILSSQENKIVGVDTADVYNYADPPGYVGADRATIVAYNTFAPVTKTTDIAFELRWLLEF